MKDIMKLKYEAIWVATTKYGECERDGLWSIKWMRWIFCLSGLSFTNIHESQDWRGGGRAYL